LDGSDEGGYYWCLGFEGEKLLASSKPYHTRREMKEQLIEVLVALQKDNFEVCGDVVDGEGKPSKLQSSVAAVAQAPLRNKLGWQVTSAHGWGILMYTVACPCQKGEVMVLFEKQVVVGTNTFDIIKHSPSPVGCDVYLVGPAKPPLSLSLNKQRKC